MVGGGFLGSEMAVALAHKGRVHGTDVTQVFPEKGNMAKVLPEYLSQWSTARVVEEGVTVVANDRITAASATEAGRVELTLASGKTLTADQVVVAVGLEPNTDLAKKARLEEDPVRGGVLVNAELEVRPCCTPLKMKIPPPPWL